MIKTKIKNVFNLIISFLLTILITSPVSAGMSNTTLDELYANGVYYYNPEGIIGACATGSVNLAGSNYEEWVWSGLISIGFTETQAAGIMGNMDHESNYLNPVQHEAQFQNRGWDTTYNDASISYGVGLIQWSWGRRVQLLHSINDNYPDLIQYFKNIERYSKGYTIDGKKFVELVGENIAKQIYAAELDFLKDESENSEKSSYEKFRNESSTPEEAAKSYRKYVERGGYTDTGRIESAQKYYNKFNGQTFGSSNGCVDSGSLQEFVLKYAWPTYHKATFTERMPDYASAVSRRLCEGTYGGATRKGVAGLDCGGFVTTRHQYSGVARE